jgi:hypothetical protein
MIDVYIIITYFTGDRYCEKRVKVELEDDSLLRRLRFELSSGTLLNIPFFLEDYYEDEEGED